MKLKQVVVCEDDLKTLRDLRIIFNTKTSKVIKEFSNGAEFLEWFKLHSTEIDLIVLDIILKKIDGFALFHEIKTIKRDMDIIIISIENSVAVIKYLVSLGIKDYVTKPYQLDILKRRLSRFIN